MNNSLSNAKISWNSLSEDERNSIEVGLKQLENGEGVDFEEVNKSIDESLKG